MKRFNHSQRQHGAALVVGLVLLVVVTVLAISGMNTATTELAIARNDQTYENAFQAAETGLERALAHGFYPTTGLDLGVHTINDHDSVAVQVTFDTVAAAPEGYSYGTASRYYFVATATAESNRIAGGGGDTDRDASAVHTQTFYVIGPSGPSL